MAVAARPALLLPGLRPVDPSLETHWVRPGRGDRGAAAPGRPAHGPQPRRRPGRRADRDRRRGRRGRCRDRRPRRRRRDGAARARPRRRGRRAARGSTRRGPASQDARALRLFDDATPRGAEESFDVERAATAIVAAPGGRVVDGDWPASPLLIEIRRASPERRRRSNCRRRWPSRGSTSASTWRAPPYEVEAGSTSRSSTCRESSARTSSPSTATSSSAGSSAGSTRPPPGR